MNGNPVCTYECQQPKGAASLRSQTSNNNIGIQNNLWNWYESMMAALFG